MRRRIGGVADYQISQPSFMASCAWTVILMFAVMAGSLVLSCSAPFAALAIALTATVGTRASLLTVAFVWLVNQIVGFTFFHFPLVLNTVLWGLVIGVAALLTIPISGLGLRRLASRPPLLRLALCLALSFVSYESLLWLAALFLGGRETFSASITTQLALINGAWLLAMIALNEITAAFCRPWLGRIPMMMRSPELT